MENKEGTFQYSYCAQERAEIERIRQKYMAPQQDKMTQLRALDRSASQTAQAWAVTLGILGALILGTGMSLTMTQLNQLLGLKEGMAMLLGITVGVVGLVLVALAYPLYNRVLKRQRQRIAPQILQLTEELMK